MTVPANKGNDLPGFSCLIQLKIRNAVKISNNAVGSSVIISREFDPEILKVNKIEVASLIIA